MATVTFGRKATVENFLAMNNIVKGQKVFFNYMCKKGSTDPAFYNDEDGKETTIRRMAFQDEAGNTLAFLSSKVAEEYASGKNIQEGGLQFVETTTERVNPETAEIEKNTAWVLCHPNHSNSIDASAIFGL